MESSSTSTTTPPWLPVLADHHHHQLLHNFTPASASSPSTPPSHHHHLLPRAAPATRRVTKRRPRPSRRLPTTYISADPASFRRMVHQVTGADDLPQPTNADLLTRPAPIRPAAGGSTSTSGPDGALINMLLPTLDTSAFLVGALSRTPTEAPTCDGSAASPAAAPALEMKAGGACNSRRGGGFPTLESWDHHALF